MEIQIEKDENGDLILPLPQELLDELGWREGDDLIWEVTNDIITLRKADESFNR